MTAGEESIREQLQRLLGIKPQGEERGPMRPSAGAKPKKDREQPRRGVDAAPTDQSWKVGVRPLRVNGRSIGPAKFGPSRFRGRRPIRSQSNRTAKIDDKVPAPKPNARAALPKPVPKPGVGPAARPASPPKAPAPALPRHAPTPALSTAANFRFPEPWVEKGRQLQLDAGRGATLLVRVGIDFGSAYSKLAIRVPGKVFLLDFDGLVNAKNAFLLGGELSELDSGEAYVGIAPDARQVATNLKLPFLGVAGLAAPDDLARATAFVAWLMRYARAWLYERKPAILKGNTLVWEVNMGAPTGAWSQGDRLLEHYQRMGLAAWRLSQDPRISVADAARLLQHTDAGSNGWGLDSLGIVPEFAAQIAGYVKSPQRTDGLYLLADVGAGTLDVACFRIMRIPRTRQDRFPVFASNVEPLGAHYLMQARDHLLGRSIPGWTSMRKVPSAQAYASSAGVPLKNVLDADREFERLVTRVAHRVLTKTRHHMDRSAQEWKTAMPVFFAGGGASLEPYRNGVAHAFKELGFHHFPRSFPHSRDIDASFKLDDEVIGRTSVAYGLTFDAEEIGEFVPQEEIKPQATSVEPEIMRPDREELYPK